MNVPDNLKYTKDHEWVKIDGGQITVGVTEYAQAQLGDIVYVELPKDGEDVSKDETVGVLESVKAVSDCFAPLSGKIMEVNSALSDSPQTVNEDCYGEGWMIKMEISNTDELKELMDDEQYAQYLAEETA